MTSPDKQYSWREFDPDDQLPKHPQLQKKYSQFTTDLSVSSARGTDQKNLFSLRDCILFLGFSLQLIITIQLFLLYFQNEALSDRIEEQNKKIEELTNIVEERELAW